MKRHVAMPFAAAAALVAIVGAGLMRAAPAGAQAESGWTVLFDGKSLDNWDQVGDADWHIEDGAVVADKGNGFLVSKQSYTDFQLRAEFWADEDVNSGIYFRCIDPKNITNDTAQEANIFDNRPDPSYGTGALVNVGKVDPMPKAAGKWNTYEITAKGQDFTLVLNGQKTVDNAHSDKFPSGRIALQHGLGVMQDKGVIKFRKVEINPL